MGKIKDGFDQSTVSHMKSCLAGVLGLAVDDEVIAKNPAHGLGKIFRNKPMNEDVNPLSIEELRHLLSVFENDFPEHYPMTLTLARTGMRFGEALELKRGDINFENRFIKVQRTYSRGKIGLPKNGRSRIVDMSLQLTAVLREHLLQQKHDALKYGWGFVPEWVFGNKKASRSTSTIGGSGSFTRRLKRPGCRK